MAWSPAAGQSLWAELRAGFLKSETGMRSQEYQVSCNPTLDCPLSSRLSFQRRVPSNRTSPAPSRLAGPPWPGTPHLPPCSLCGDSDPQASQGPEIHPSSSRKTPPGPLVTDKSRITSNSCNDGPRTRTFPAGRRGPQVHVRLVWIFECGVSPPHGRPRDEQHRGQTCIHKGGSGAGGDLARDRSSGCLVPLDCSPAQRKSPPAGSPTEQKPPRPRSPQEQEHTDRNPWTTAS